MNNKSILNITLSGLFLALAIILPFITGNIKEIGNMLCPMHIPVFLCGYICGKKNGLIIGVISPILRSLIFGLPPIYPTATAMAIELACYGFVCSFIFDLLTKKNINYKLSTFISLIISMILGRIVWGISMSILLLFDGSLQFSLKIFLVSSFANAWLGIIFQFIIIPIIVITYNTIIKKD